MSGGSLVDLRSDTVTRPTEAMRTAMARADVGDDVYGEDPTVNALEERVAALFGHQKALFTPTGSMANLLAVRSLVAPGQEVLCESSAHIARAELGAHGAFFGVTMRTWTGRNGRIDTPAIEAMFAPDISPFYVPTKAISIENSHNFGGGTVQRLEEIDALTPLIEAHDIGLHVDGARIWNAATALEVPLSELGRRSGVLTVCLSKGLGAPAGSLVLGSAPMIDEARVWRKRLGGGMRQVGVLAAAGLHALEHHYDRLGEDHAHAAVLAEACGVDPAGVDTNIVVVSVPDSSAVVAAARQEGVLLSALGPTTIRLVTHLDVSRAMVDRAAVLLSRLVVGEES